MRIRILNAGAVYQKKSACLDELEKLEDGRVEEVVAVVVGHQRLNHRDKQVTLHNTNTTVSIKDLCM